ncbi:MAG: hypothetical protein GYB68_14755, partial [Chloroflexi bacterium]|nr:hypothetical protein [Chloroflexota bacterium]
IGALGFQTVAGMALPGFSYQLEDGEQGSVYADMLNPGRLVHISHSGTDCSVEQLTPVLETLRFN